MATQVPYQQMATDVNQFMTGQSMAPYLANLPNFAANVGKRSENTKDMLSGQLPQDVMQQIAQQAAERGISGGAPGSPNAGAAYLRALGLNSLKMQQQGSQQFSQEIADTPVPELWNPMSLHVPMTLGKEEQSAAASGAGAATAQANQKAMQDAWAKDYQKRQNNWMGGRSAPIIGF